MGASSCRSAARTDRLATPQSLAHTCGTSWRIHARHCTCFVVVVAGLEALSWAPHRVVAILGLDEELLPQATLSSQVMAAVDPDLNTRSVGQVGDPDPRRTAMGALLGAVFAARETLLVSWNVTDETTGQALDPPIALSEFLEVFVRTNQKTSANGPTVDALLLQQVHHARRHGFSGSHGHPRFDTRLRELEQPHGSVPEAQLQSAPQSAAIDDLHSFFRDPAGFHLRSARNLSTPRSLEVPPVRPALSVDGLTKFRLQEAFIQASFQLDSWTALLQQVENEDSYQSAFASWRATTGELFDRLSRSEEFAGDVPTRLWLDEELKTRLDLFTFNLAFDLAGFAKVAGSLGEVQPTLLLHGGGSVLLSGAVTPSGSDLFNGIVESKTTSELHLLRYRTKVGESAGSHNGRMVGDLLDLLVLEALFPDRTCVVTTFYLPKSSTPVKKASGGRFVPVGGYVLNPLFHVRRAPGVEVERTPLDQLDVLWSLFQRGFEEPLALFRKTSEAFAFASYARVAKLDSSELWTSSTPRVHGESSTAVHQLLFPFDFEELCTATRFSELAEELQKAARGVEYVFAPQTNRPASAALSERHPGFVSNGTWPVPILLVEQSS